jgi:hypothetical protein
VEVGEHDEHSGQTATDLDAYDSSGLFLRRLWQGSTPRTTVSCVGLWVGFIGWKWDGCNVGVRGLEEGVRCTYS